MLYPDWNKAEKEIVSRNISEGLGRTKKEVIIPYDCYVLCQSGGIAGGYGYVKRDEYDKVESFLSLGGRYDQSGVDRFLMDNNLIPMKKGEKLFLEATIVFNYINTKAYALVYFIPYKR